MRRVFSAFFSIGDRARRRGNCLENRDWRLVVRARLVGARANPGPQRRGTRGTHFRAEFNSPRPEPPAGSIGSVFVQLFRWSWVCNHSKRSWSIPLIGSQTAIPTMATSIGSTSNIESYCGASTAQKFLMMNPAPPSSNKPPSTRDRYPERKNRYPWSIVSAP